MIKILKRSRKEEKKTNNASKKNISTQTTPEAKEENQKLNEPISHQLDNSLQQVKESLGQNADLIIRRVNIGRQKIKPAAVVYFDNMIDKGKLDQELLRPLLLDVYTSGLSNGDEIVTQLQAGNLISRGEMQQEENRSNLLAALVEGQVVLLIEGMSGGLLWKLTGYQYRAIGISDTEPVVRGSKDAFNEVLNINISQIRRRLKTTELVMTEKKIGNKTQTRICIAYLKNVVQPGLVAEVNSRLDRINIDGVLESGYIEELIQDNPYSPFPQIVNTERPDRVVASLLEGRVAILTDNTPVALIVPGEFNALMQAPDDYYNRYFFVTILRLLRYFSLMVAVLLPAVYIAVTSYHQEMIPTKLLISIMSSRQGVPFPSFIEAILMEVAFEILREAGVRLPKSIGQAVSIVGALVIGDAAVKASLVSPLMVIVVALTGIANFTIPQYNISLSVRAVRFFLMILGAVLGMFGVVSGLIVIILHLCALRSFGVPYLSPMAPFQATDIKDSVVRVPWWAMNKLPSQIAGAVKREGQKQKPIPPEEEEKK